MSDVKKIDVKLIREEGTVKLRFHFDNPLDISMTTDQREDIKVVFIKILQQLESNQIKLNYIDDDTKDLFQDSASLYVKILSDELAAISSTFPKKLH